MSLGSCKVRCCSVFRPRPGQGSSSWAQCCRAVAGQLRLRGNKTPTQDCLPKTAAETHTELSMFLLSCLQSRQTTISHQYFLCKAYIALAAVSHTTLQKYVLFRGVGNNPIMGEQIVNRTSRTANFLCLCSYQIFWGAKIIENILVVFLWFPYIYCFPSRL